MRLERSLFGEILDITTVRLEFSSLSLFDVFFTRELGESPFVGNDNLLSSGELVLASTQGFNHDSLVGILCSDRDQNLTNVDTGSSPLRFAPSTSHSLLETSA